MTRLTCASERANTGCYYHQHLPQPVSRLPSLWPPQPRVRNTSSWLATCAIDDPMTPSTNGPSALSTTAPAPARFTTSTVRPETSTTKPYVLGTDLSASSIAVCAATPTATNTPPGPTASQPLLDDLHPWNVYNYCTHPEASTLLRAFAKPVGSGVMSGFEPTGLATGGLSWTSRRLGRVSPNSAEGRT